VKLSWASTLIGQYSGRSPGWIRNPT
jgi:hypothetical protein